MYLKSKVREDSTVPGEKVPGFLYFQQGEGSSSGFLQALCKLREDALPALDVISIC